jgi:hypothetical protein
VKAPHAARHRFEMGITRVEFLRLLPVAVGHAVYRIEGDDIEAEDDAWWIRVEEQPGRRFGAVVLPVLAVTLVLGAMKGAEARIFVERFLLGYQRAGG